MHIIIIVTNQSACSSFYNQRIKAKANVLSPYPVTDDFYQLYRTGVNYILGIIKCIKPFPTVHL